MKRALSLVLAAALVLGSVPAGFAATPTAGETLKGYGLAAGVDATGNLAEDKTITRGEMMVVLARLLGKFEEAKAYSIPSTSKDVAGHWAANYIAYAEKEKWTAGKGNGMFDPQGTVTLQELSVFMLNALSYTPEWNTAVKAATDLGLLKEVVAKDAAAKVLRADVFTAALNTINTPVKDTTVKLGVKLGVLKADPAAALALDSAKAVSFKVVEVKLTAEAKEVKAADFAVTDADGKAVEVKAATLIDSKTVWLDTADQAAGKVYTVKVADKTVKFTGVAKDATSPVVQASSKVMDNVTVKVVFDKEVDPRTALVAANYTADNNLQVTKAVWNKNADGDAIKTEVLLTTSAQTSGTLYKLTVATKVTDLAGNAVKSADDANIIKFGGIKADTTLPKLTSAMGKNAVKVTLTFKEDSGLDKATAENVANYTLTNKTDAAKTATVTKAELKQNAADKDIWNVVELTTSAQTVGNIYEVAAKNVADKFGNVISTTADYKTTFSGQPADTTGPQVVTVEVKTNTAVKVTFNEEVDKTAAETVANYAINNDLTVVKAALDSTKKIVTLTTSTQKAGTAYKVTVTNVTDEYANKIGSSNNSGYFSGIAVDDKKPTVLSALASVDGSKTYVTVTFSEGMNDTAKVASNYFFGDAIGYGVEVEKKSDAVYKVRVNALEDLKNYTVKVTGVEDASANGIDTDNNTANFVGKATADSDAPKVVGAVALDKNTIQVLFSRPVKINSTSETQKPYNTAVSGVIGDGTPTAYAEDVDNYKLVVKGDKATTGNMIQNYNNVTSYVSKDRKSVTLRFQTGSAGVGSTVTLVAGKVYEVYVNATDNVSADFPFDGASSSAITADNDIKLASSDSYTTMGSSTADVTVPEMVAAYAMNTTTVNIKFNTPIKHVPTTGAIEIGGVAYDKDNTSVSSSDNTVLVVKTATLTAGTVYTVEIKTAAAITDIYSDKVANTAVTQKLTAPSTVNDKPAIGSVSVINASQIQVTLTEDVKTPNAALFTVNGKVAKLVEFNDSKVKNVINVYFDNTGMTPGSVYKLEIAANGLTDLVGQPNTDKLSADFAATGDSLVKVKISDVVKLTDNKVRVIFNRPVVDGTTTLIGSDFSGGTFTLVGAYLGGSSVTVSSNTVAAGSYVDSIDLQVASNILATTKLTITPPAGLKAKDGAVLDGSGAKDYYGSISNTQPLVAETTAGVAGVKQVVEHTVATASTAAANITVDGVTVALANNDTVAQVATKIAATTLTNWDVAVKSGTTATLVFTAKVAAANTTVSFADTGTTGVTLSAASVTTAGVLAVKEVTTITINEAAAQTQTLTVTFADGTITKDVSVSVTKDDTAATIATALKTALAGDSTLAADYDFTNAAAVVTATQKTDKESNRTVTVTIK